MASSKWGYLQIRCQIWAIYLYLYLSTVIFKTYEFLSELNWTLGLRYLFGMSMYKKILERWRCQPTNLAVTTFTLHCQQWSQITSYSLSVIKFSRIFLLLLLSFFFSFSVITLDLKDKQSHQHLIVIDHSFPEYNIYITRNHLLFTESKESFCEGDSLV